jgi:hypothetical protein
MNLTVIWEGPLDEGLARRKVATYTAKQKIYDSNARTSENLSCLRPHATVIGLHGVNNVNRK